MKPKPTLKSLRRDAEDAEATGPNEVSLRGRDVLALLDCVAALESISSRDKPRHETEEYWIKISHEQCATVLATDTKIARAALENLRRVLKGEK